MKSNVRLVLISLARGREWKVSLIRPGLNVSLLALLKAILAEQHSLQLKFPAITLLRYIKQKMKQKNQRTKNDQEAQKARETGSKDTATIIVMIPRLQSAWIASSKLPSRFYGVTRETL